MTDHPYIMRMVCIYCRVIYGFKRSTTPGDGHGICDRCAAQPQCEARMAPVWFCLSKGGCRVHEVKHDRK